MRAANIPLEGSEIRKWLHPQDDTDHATISCTVMWNDLELYHNYRDFTVDPVAYPAHEMRDFIRSLVRQPALLV